jgi:acyl-CoA synthetase (AMP-forming)/AMP-acid ligase II
MNGIDFLDRGWALNPDGFCLIEADTGKGYTYEEVREATFRIGAAIRDRGYGIGTNASVLGHNDPRAFQAFLSIMRVGATVIPVNARNTVAENAEIFDRIDCELLFIHSEFADEVETIRELAPRIKEIVCVDAAAAGLPSLEEWTDGYDSTPFDLPHDPDRVYGILMTGGTTGVSKGIVWPNTVLEVGVIANFTAAAPCDVPPVFLAAAPLTHFAGLFMQYVMSQGGTGIVLGRADKQLILEVIPKYGITHVFLPPTVIYDLLLEPNVRDVDYSSLRYFIYSAAPMAPEKVREAIDVFGPVMCQIYGQSEAAWDTILLPSDHVLDGDLAPIERLASCGRPFPFVRMEIMDEEGNLLGPDEPGELVVRGLGVMREYYKNPEATAEVAGHDWHHTGDLGYRDEEGFFYVVDRAKDMIISGGFNIFSFEVERAVLEHPAIQDCAVVGVPHDRWGEAVTAVVQLKSGESLDEDDLIAFCRERVGGMKAPKQVVFVDDLPRNANGKILKREVRERFWVGQGRRVA